MKLLIVDDHPLVRKGLMSILSLEDSFKEIVEASNLSEACNILLKVKPDIAVIDLKLSREDGLDLVKFGKNRLPKTKYIILTSSMREGDFIRARNVGVDGYILKEAITEDLLYAISLVKRGKKYYDPYMMEYTYITDNTIDHLTMREKEVLNELAAGLSNIEIANKLFISENTVKKHVSNILSKLDLNHRTEAALYANNMYLKQKRVSL